MDIKLVPLTVADREQFILGFHIVEFWNKYQRGPAVPDDIEENWSDEDEMFLFRKIITKQ